MLRALLVFVLLFSVASSLTHLQVKSSCTGLTNCYTSLNYAASNATAGDVITVDAGTWTLDNNIDLEIPVSIVGAGSGSTVIDCSSNYYEIELYYSPFYFQGFNITRCDEIYVESASAVFQDVLVYNAWSYIMYAYYASITCRDCTFQACDAYAYVEYSTLRFEGDLNLIDLTDDYAIEVEEGSSLYVDGSVIAVCNAASEFSEAMIYFDDDGQSGYITGDFNSTGCNGALVFAEEASVVIDGDVTITNNSYFADYFFELEYGAALVINGDVTIQNCHDTTSTYGAFIYVEYGGAMIIEGDLTIQNVVLSASEGFDGVIYLEYGGELLVTGSMLISNINGYATGSSYVIYLDGGLLANVGPVTITNIYLNGTSDYWYAIYVEYGTWTTIEPLVISNVNGAYYTLLYVYEANLVNTDFTLTNNRNYYSDGYTMYQEESSWVAVGDVTLSYNNAYYGTYIDEGGMIVYGSFVVANNTGGDYSAYYLYESGLITYGPALFENNMLTDSTGSAFGTEYGGWVSFDTVTFTGNTQDAVYLYESSWIAQGDVIFTNNNGPYGALYLDEYASWITSGAVTFNNNKANGSGGAVGIYTYSVWESNGPVTFTNNVAGANGGAVYIEDDYALWSSKGPMTFSGNVAQYGGAVYVGYIWANSYFNANFTGNNGITSADDVFCDSDGSFFFMNSGACNTSTITCVPGCWYGTITNTVSVTSHSISLNGVSQTGSATITLATALPVDLTISYEFVSSTGLVPLVPLVFTPSSATIAAGSTTASLTVGVLGSVASTGLSIQGSIQLIPPTPELLVLLDGNSFSFPFTVRIPGPSSGASDLLSFSWLSLFHDALHMLL